MKMIARSGVAVLTAALLLTVGFRSASAHERRQVGGYVLVVGFENEPTFVEELNGASITIFSTDGKAVDGADKTLKVEVTTGGTSRTFDLESDGGKAGAYKAEFIPTKTGSYTFRFFGSIGVQQVNERFESGPGRFDEVSPKSDLQFPAKVPTNGELAAQASGGQSATSGGDAGQALTQAKSARDRANTAMMLGIAGLVVGVIGAGIGAYGLSAARRTPAQTSSRDPRTGEPV